MQAIKVLIVDKEMEFTSILSDRLCSWGFAATGANSAEEALAALSALAPEVAVLVLRDRDSRGLDLMSMIKENNPAVHVILLPCKGAAIAGMRGMERGAADCIPLPLELGVLINSIRKVTGSSHSIEIEESDF
jgi:DNA-binding response OmpR family regulator